MCYIEYKFAATKISSHSDLYIDFGYWIDNIDRRRKKWSQTNKQTNYKLAFLIVQMSNCTSSAKFFLAVVSRTITNSKVKAVNFSWVHIKLSLFQKKKKDFHLIFRQRMLDLLYATQWHIDYCMYIIAYTAEKCCIVYYTSSITQYQDIFYTLGVCYWNITFEYCQ